MRTVPYEVLAEFCPPRITAVRRLSGGQVNSTFLVTDSNADRYIVQQMGQAVDPNTVHDYAVVAEHLRTKGWDMAQPLRTSDDQLVVPDQAGKPWRGYTFIDSDPVPPAASHPRYVEFASLLGRLSADLSSLDYTPIGSIPHFHDTAHFVSRLADVAPHMPPAEQEFASQLKECVGQEPPIDGIESMIHGDPKLNNALYRNGSPFTLIDWDTMMLGSPMLDLADMLRSMSGTLRESLTNFSARSLLNIIQSYRAAAGVETDENSFYEQAISTTRTMCLTLAARYLIDSVEGTYFQWNPDRFASLAEQNRSQAMRQWRNYQALLQE